MQRWSFINYKNGVYSKNYNVQKYIFNIEIFISTVSELLCTIEYVLNV